MKPVVSWLFINVCMNCWHNSKNKWIIISYSVQIIFYSWEKIYVLHVTFCRSFYINGTLHTSPFCIRCIINLQFCFWSLNCGKLKVWNSIFCDIFKQDKYTELFVLCYLYVTSKELLMHRIHIWIVSDAFSVKSRFSCYIYNGYNTEFSEWVGDKPASRKPAIFRKTPNVIFFRNL